MRAISPLPIATVAGMLLLLFAPACGDEDVGPGPEVTLALRVESHGPFARVSDFRGPADRMPHIPYVDLALRDVAPPREPVAGVRVALDRPDGTRLGEADSDADGLVVFEVARELWPEDVAVTATAYKDGYMMHTVTGIARPSSAEPMALRIGREAQGPPELVSVSGTVNRSSGDNNLAINVLAPYGGFFGGYSNVYELEVPKGVSFDLLATEYRFSFQSYWDSSGQFIQTARVSSDGVEEDSIIDIDFAADRVASIEVPGSFTLPARDGSPLRQSTAFPHLIAFAGDSYYRGVTGFGTRVHLDGDVVDYTIGLVETPEYNGTSYTYRVQVYPMELHNQGPMSYAYGRGRPEGEQPQLLDLPEWVTEPQDLVAGHPVDEPLSWETFDAAVNQYVWVAAGDEVVWVVEVPDDTTSVTLPAPPSNVDLTELLGDSPCAMVALERQIDSDEGVFWLESWGDELPLDLGDQLEPSGGLPTAEDWMAHLEDEVMPFWMVDDALGVPEGNFPTFRCNDGTLPDPVENRFHELEHILVGCLTGQAIAGEPAELWFAFDDDAYNTVAVPTTTKASRRAGLSRCSRGSRGTRRPS